MLILNTVSHETIWGGQKLLPYAEGNFNKIGHLYSLCCEKGLENLILNGKYKGQPFQTYFQDNKGKFGLDNYEEFPLIIALVEAKDNLSIQVHPDDEVAKSEEGAAYGKNESWYFMEPPTNGKIFNGCLLRDKADIEERLSKGEYMSVVDYLSVSQGDYVYVEAGTLHALASGAFLYEIEENSPWTYRFYDFDRVDAAGNKRELHTEKALKALKPELKSSKKHLGNEEIEERRYVVRKLEGVKIYQNKSVTLECLTLIQGEAVVEGLRAKTGTTIVMEPGEKLEGNFELAIVARPK